jgi:hypothetical protein
MQRAVRLLSPLLFAFLLSLPLSAQVTGTFERTLKVTGPVDLTVQTGSGSITVRTGDTNTVRVVGQIRASDWTSWFSGDSAEERVRRLEQNPPIEQDGNTIRIGRIEDDHLRRNVSISYDLIVPAETQLKSSSGSGGHSIAGIRGPVEARTGSGRIQMFNVDSEVRASTGSGAIELDKVGAARASTGSGGIRASRVEGGLHGRTGSGTIRVDGASGRLDLTTGSGGVQVQGFRGALRARTGSGSIRVEGAPAGDWDLQAGSGSVRLSLPRDTAFRLDARTTSGRVSVDHPLEIEHQHRQRELRGTARGGGPLLNLRTGSGSVTVN